MAQKKIPFDCVLAGKAIAAYLRKNASYISFVGEVNDVDSVMTVQISSITCLEGKNHYAFSGIARLKYQLDDGMKECCYNISASCTMVMEEDDEIGIKDMSVIYVCNQCNKQTMRIMDKFIKHLWWIGTFISIALIIILRFTDWRPIVCEPKVADGGNFTLESLSFSYLAAAIFYILNEYIPQRRKNEVYAAHIERQIISIKEYIRQIVASIEPFKMDENKYTLQTFAKTFADKDLKTKLMDGQTDLESYINKRRELVETLCDQLLSSYGNVMSYKEINYINTILKSDFICNQLVPMDFNVPKQYISSYPNNQQTIGNSIFNLYELGKDIKYERNE